MTGSTRIDDTERGEPIDDVGVLPVGERLARALAGGDRAALLGLLAPEIDFAGLTPGRAWEARSAADAVDVMVGTWFGGDRRIEAILAIECDTVVDRERVGYRFRATTPAGAAIVEQQAYLAVDAGVVTLMRVLCTGFRPISA